MLIYGKRTRIGCTSCDTNCCQLVIIGDELQHYWPFMLDKLCHCISWRLQSLLYSIHYFLFFLSITFHICEFLGAFPLQCYDCLFLRQTSISKMNYNRILTKWNANHAISVEFLTLLHKMACIFVKSFHVFSNSYLFFLLFCFYFCNAYAMFVAKEISMVPFLSTLKQSESWSHHTLYARWACGVCESSNIVTQGRLSLPPGDISVDL